MKTTRIAAFGLLIFGAACGGVPASNPIPDTADPDIPLLSDLDVPEDAASVTLAAPVTPQSEGFLAGLLGGNRTSPPTAVDSALADAIGDDLSESAEIEADAVATAPERQGFMGRIFNARAGGAAPAVAAQPSNAIPPRTIMAFGDIGPTCGLSNRDLGTKISEGSGFAIYDTIPNSTAARPHYITGFNDGCARQFTAALVLMGDVGTHEVVRYNRTRVDLPYSETDNAYEAIKTSFCRTGFGQPCGARLERLARGTTFVTAYERFGAGPIWAEFLLHNGEVAASTIEGN